MERPKFLVSIEILVRTLIALRQLYHHLVYNIFEKYNIIQVSPIYIMMLQIPITFKKGDSC